MFDKVVNKETFNDPFVEISRPFTAVLDIKPDGSQNLVKKEGFDEEQSYAILGGGYMTVGFYNLPKKGEVTITKEKEIIPNALYPLFPIRNSIFEKKPYVVPGSANKQN